MNIDLALERLHYSPRWLQYGFIDQPTLISQLTAFEANNFDCSEHFRFDSFARMLNSITQVNDLTIDHFIELAELDEDETMAQSALAMLVSHKYLTQPQLLRLSDHPAFQIESLRQIIRRRVELLRDLDGSQLTSELVQRCILICDDTVQRKLLNRSDISAEHLESLKLSGANRAVKNLASEKLTRLRHAGSDSR